MLVVLSMILILAERTDWDDSPWDELLRDLLQFKRKKHSLYVASCLLGRYCALSRRLGAGWSLR